MLEVKNLVVKYGDFTAVNDISFTVNKGEIFGLLGTNGSGKSTTFRSAIGLLAPFSGSVLYNGEKISYANIDEVGYLIEERSLLSKYKVNEITTYFGRLKSLDTQTINERLDFWLDFFDVPQYKTMKIKKLSKGNQQKIQFIIAVLNNPKLLILDEPFSGLDPVNMNMFINAINELKKRGTIIIFSSHQIEMVEHFCEKVMILEKGEAIVSGLIKEVKKEFPTRKVNIIAEGIDLDLLKETEGVLSVSLEKDGIVELSITDDSIVDKLFEYVKTLKSVRKFEMKYATLTEIFVKKVGEKRE